MMGIHTTGIQTGAGMSKGIRIGIVVAAVALFAIAIVLKEGGRSGSAATGPSETPPVAGSAQAGDVQAGGAVPLESVAGESASLESPGAGEASLQSSASSASPESPAAMASQDEAALPRLVKLGSDKCIPCKMMAPILEELHKEYAGRMIIEEIDVRENRAAASLYSVRVIPTQIFYDGVGTELFRQEGFMDKAAILSKWQDLGFDL